MVAYYEAPDAHPPAHLLPQMAQVLGVSVDVLGVNPLRRPKKLATNRLERQFMAIEKLDTAEKHQIIQIIDTFIERGKLKQRVNAQEA